MSKEYKSITGGIMGNIGKTGGAGGFILVIGLPLFIAIDVIFFTLFILLSNKENGENVTEKEKPNTDHGGTWDWYEKKLAEGKKEESKN